MPRARSTASRVIPSSRHGDRSEYMYRKYSGHLADGTAAGRRSEDDGTSAAIGGGDGDAAAAWGQVGNAEDVSLTQVKGMGIGARSAPDIVGVWRAGRPFRPRPVVAAPLLSRNDCTRVNLHDVFDYVLI